MLTIKLLSRRKNFGIFNTKEEAEKALIERGFVREETFDNFWV